MTRLRALVIVSTLLVPLASLRPQAQAQAPAVAAMRPNVVVVMTDGIGYGDLTEYGGAGIKTPNLDGLVKDGTRLTDFYANAPLSSPTRAAFVTGRYQERVPFEREPNSGAQYEKELAATGRSMPQLLKANGYATALIGKWGLGLKTETSPRAHGFDYFFGYRGEAIDYYAHTGFDGKPDLWENDKPAPRSGYMTDLITTASVQFIQQNATKPFFIEVAYGVGHTPFQPPDKPSSRAPNNGKRVLADDVKASTYAEYVAMVERVDRGVGEILQALDRGRLAPNTLVIVTNATGGDWLARNEPLFHGMGTLWEGGIRVPTILRWPGHVPAGRISDQVGITMDLTASILSATNTTVPANTHLEGIDLLPVLEGHVPEVERTLFWRTQAGSLQRAVRKGDWKVLVDGNHLMVYDLRKDLAEHREVAYRRPDVAHDLRPLIAAWEADVDNESGVAAANAAGRGRGGRGGGPGPGAPAAPAPPGAGGPAGPGR